MKNDPLQASWKSGQSFENGSVDGENVKAMFNSSKHILVKNMTSTFDLT